jgi:hypothetical protein
LTTDLGNKLALAGGTMSGAIAMGTNKITGLGDPTSAQDAATKAYVDTTSQGIDWKASVRAATTANVTLASALENGDTLDGVTLATGDRILVKNQATGSENGIYTVNASGAPTRALDANSSADITAGMFTFVEQGTVNGDTGWVLTTNQPITLDTTALVFTQFSGTGTYSASNGVLLTGTNFTFAPSTTGGLTTGSGGGAVLLPSTSGLKTDSAGLALNPTSDGGLTTSSSGSYILLATNSGLATSASGLTVTAGLGITTTAAGDAGAATANQVAIASTQAANGFTLGPDNRINVTNAGIYYIDLSLQLAFTGGASNFNVTVWYTIDDVIVPNSAFTFTTSSQQNDQTLARIADTIALTAGQYLKFYWWAPATGMRLLPTAAGTNPTRPLSPSVNFSIFNVG